MNSALSHAVDMWNSVFAPQDRNDQIFRQLEEVFTVSVEPPDTCSAPPA
jgi:hypothetical protein